ncbi:MAG: NAD(P)H-dependent oxidoreductase, partial [Selenomonadaceae bacterium]|nr:NAD(P)H-dependent oxidoreductase [Selenomonadaceae bacterium]
QTKLMPQMLAADLLVLVTPLYYFGMSAQLKTVVDRFYSRTTKLSGKKSLLLATAWNSADWTMEALDNHYETLVRYMSWQSVGKVLATGSGTRSMVERSEFGDAAYKIGASL